MLAELIGQMNFVLIFPAQMTLLRQLTFLLLGASAATCEFCEWVQVEIDVYIPHRKY